MRERERKGEKGRERERKGEKGRERERKGEKGRERERKWRENGEKRENPIERRFYQKSCERAGDEEKFGKNVICDSLIPNVFHTN